MSVMWNLWHGCHKYSAGCENCYVYRSDKKHGRDASKVERTSSFTLPVKKDRLGGYKIPAGEMVYTCFTSDFFVSDADKWRSEAWDMMKKRGDLLFLFITKRIERFYECIPDDWGEGYPNVHICVTAENEDMARKRLPFFLKIPARYKSIVCEPLLGPIDLSPYLGPAICQVIAGGESGENARTCSYEWIYSLKEQCRVTGVSFWFKQTGARFEKNGKVYKVKRKFQHRQARKSGLSIGMGKNFYHDFQPLPPEDAQMDLFESE